MTSITKHSTLQQSLNLRARVSEQKAAVDKASSELSTGYRQDVFETRGASPAQALELRARLSSNESFRVANELLSREMEVTSTVLADMRQTMGDFTKILVSGDITANNRGMLKDNAKVTLAALVDKLNTTYNGSHLFSGRSTDVKPMSVAADSSVSYVGDAAGNLSRRVDDDTVLEYGLRGDDPAFMSAFETLTRIINTDFDAMNYQEFSDFRAAAAQTIAQSGEGMTTLQSRLGDQQGRLERTIDSQHGLENILTRAILDIEGVDAEEAAIRLEGLTTQLQSTFEVTARMSKLTLLNYI